MTRIARLAAQLDEPLLVLHGINITYLTGFLSSNAALLVTPDGCASLYTDFRYAEAAQAVEGVTFTQTGRDVAGALAGLLSGQRVSFEANRISFAQHEILAAGGVDLIASRAAVEKLRAVKDDQELAAIRRACAISDDVYEALTHEPVVGRTEKEIAWFVERSFRERGAEALGFGTIVASGVNGAKPHADPGDDPIPADTLVTVDMGCVVDGYCSDSTRTFATGTLGQELADVYAIVRQAQLDGLSAVRAGERGRDVDAASRVAIEAAGLGDRYGHGLGHGVGLEIHEAPTLRAESDDTLAVGNVVSIEPGLYLPGVGGCRIEDLVAVTDDGCEVFTHFTKDLVTLS